MGNKKVTFNYSHIDKVGGKDYSSVTAIKDVKNLTDLAVLTYNQVNEQSAKQDASFNAYVEATNNTLSTVQSSITNETSERKTADENLQTQITENKSAIDTLNGTVTEEGSVQKIVTDKIAEVVNGAPESFDTLKEIADWIGNDKTGASAMSSQIATNKNDIASLQTTVAGKSNIGHTHSADDITSGTLPIERGGTGQTTQADINKAFVADLEEEESDVTDGTMFVSSYATDNGFANASATNVPYKRKFLKVWNYIKGKADDVYAKLSHTHTKSQITDFPTIPSVGNGTVTIKQNNTSMGTFTMNQSGDTTIELTDNNTTYGNATTSAAGLMSATDKTKLDGIEKGAQKNISAFNGVTIDNYHSFYAEGNEDLRIQHGDNIQLKVDVVKKDIIISATNTTYSSQSAAQNGTEVSLVTTGEKYTWNNKANASHTHSYLPLSGGEMTGIITPRKGTTDGATVSIGRTDGNVTIGATNNNNYGYTTINNDCKMLENLKVSGSVVVYGKADVSTKGIKIPVGQPETLEDGDIWIS